MDHAEPVLIACPKCDNRVPVDEPTCPHCGFPFSCDITPYGAEEPRERMPAWRMILGMLAIIFLLTSAIFTYTGYNEYHGLTYEVVAKLMPDTGSGIPIEGPKEFVYRTELVLGLLKLRAPDFYFRIQGSVTSIEYLPLSYLESEEGRRISLEGIGALATPSTGRVQIKETTAFPSGFIELYDRDVFTYAGILVHELRHIELHNMGTAPGGWREEMLCEQAAYAAVKRMDAPKAVQLNYVLYLDDPQDRRYQRWYKWYEQWE